VAPHHTDGQYFGRWEGFRAGTSRTTIAGIGRNSVTKIAILAATTDLNDRGRIARSAGACSDV
jgi:hypothetical protein